MPIPVECPECRADYRVPDNLLGKTIRCKACQASIPVNDPDASDFDDEDLEDVEALVRRKKKKKRKSAGAGNLPIIIGVAVLILVAGGVTFYFLTRTPNEKGVAALPPAAGNPGVPRPLPNNGQRITDPDQIINGKYQAGPQKFVLDTPQKGRTGAMEFGYTIIDPKVVEQANRTKGGAPRRIFLTDRVSVAVVSEGNAVESALSGITWELKGAISVRGFGSAIPSGARICLVVNAERVSNVVVVP